jgi:hypothetical protein
VNITQHQLDRTDLMVLVGHDGLVEWSAKRSREDAVALVHVTKSAHNERMTPGDLEDVARLVREVLMLTGLRDRTGDRGVGGYQVRALDDRVAVDWAPAEALPPVSGEELRAVMDRAIASVLHAAGFTVTLYPYHRDGPADEDALPGVIVTAAPRIRGEAGNSDLAEAGSGEIARAGEFRVTEAGRELAVAVVVGLGIGVATFHGAVPAGLATMLGPPVTAALNALTRVASRRAEHAADTLLDAAGKAELPVEEFLRRAVDDDRRHELLTRALAAAQDSAWRDKRRALGHALTAGVMGDDARIEEELLFVRAVDGIDEMHLRPLGLVADGGWLTAGGIAQADPGLGDGVLALLAQLQSHGLVDSRSPVTPGGAMTPEPQYSITPLGRAFLARLADDAS